MTEGRKDDSNKPRPSLIPFRALKYTMEVLEHGAKKYGADNWRELADAERRYFDAAGRHYIELGIGRRTGKVVDKDSGFHHLGHLACCALFALELYLEECEKGQEEAG